MHIRILGWNCVLKYSTYYEVCNDPTPRIKPGSSDPKARIIPVWYIIQGLLNCFTGVRLWGPIFKGFSRKGQTTQSIQSAKSKVSSRLQQKQNSKSNFSEVGNKYAYVSQFYLWQEKIPILLSILGSFFNICLAAKLSFYG